MDRDRSLDGFRGVAALSVALFHFFCAFIPRLVPEYHRADPWPGADTPLGVLYNGGFAVAIFFVLSGYVLSNSALRSERALSFRLALRYVRLAVPVLASTLLAWALLSVFPDASANLLTRVDSRWLTFVYQHDVPGWAAALYHGAFGVFVEGNSFFNNALWTMKIELVGSFFIYVTYARPLLRFRTSTLVLSSVGAVLVSRPEYAAFALGALLQEARSAGALPARWPRVALVAGLVGGAMMPGYAMRVLSFDDGVVPRVWRLGEPHGVWHVLSAALVMHAVLALPALQRSLSSPPARFLGRISFGLYLVHVPLIDTVVAASYPWLPSRLAMLALFLGLALAAGYLFTLAVDEPLLRVLRSIYHHRAKISSEYPPNTLTARSRSME